jgi:hypothetical protein
MTATDEPIGTQLPVRAPEVAEVAQVAQVAEVRTSRASRFAPDAFVAGGFGLAWLIAGLIVIVRGGFDGPMSEPVVQLLGFTHTTTLGLIEIAVGLALLLSAALQSRGGAVFTGLLLWVGGVVGVVQYESFTKTLALERGWAWFAVISGAVVAVSALVLPRFERRTSTVAHTTSVDHAEAGQGHIVR